MANLRLEAATMNSETAVLTSTEWEILSNKLPDLASITGMRDHLKPLLLPSGGDLPADGFYIILEGEVVISRSGEEIARLRSHDFFFEEQLVLPELQTDLQAIAAPNTKLLKLDKSQWELLPEEIREEAKRLIFIGDLVNVHMHDFQQPINCCNITAVAFALTALGFSTHVDDLFLKCKLPSAYVVNDGMTLGEVYNVACTYIHQNELKNKVNVQCYYFDEHIVSPQHLMDALQESEREGGNNDILVANFGVGLARNIPNNNGGHFALIAKFNPSSGLIHMVDVHPKKYGKLWLTTIDRLYSAMAQRDSSSHRSRGLLRFTTKNALTSVLDSLESNAIQADMTEYMLIGDDNVGSFFRDSTTNLNSISTVALALRQLGKKQTDTDDIIHTLRLSYTELLSKAPSPETLCQQINRYLEAIDVSDIHCRLARYSTEHHEQEGQQDFLKRHMTPISKTNQSQMIVNIDINTLMAGQAVALPNAQFSETAVLKQFWCVCIDYDTDSQIVTLADCTVCTSFVWQTKVDLLLESLEDKADPGLILISKDPVSVKNQAIDPAPLVP